MSFRNKLTKIFIITGVCMISLLCGCKKEEEPVTPPEQQLFPNEFELVDDNGTIKCSNLKYVICLEKKKGEDFKILNLADIQLSTEDIGLQNNTYKHAKNLIKTLIEETNPDLITLTGDQGYGEEKSIKFVGSVIDPYNIPWAPVFGNHDNQCDGLSQRNQIKLYQTYPNCLFKYGPSQAAICEELERGGNYIINIVERDDNGGFHIVRTLFMLNSGGEKTTADLTKPTINNTKYDHLTDKQIAFYKWGLECAKKYNNGEYPKSTIVQHMPITEYAHAFAAAFYTNFTGYELTKILGNSTGCSILDSYNGNCWKDGYKDSFGVCYEMICCSPNDDGIFEVLKEYGSTDSMIVGHDHNNNFSVNYEGIKLTFALKTGYGCYFNSKLIGGTVMTVSDRDITFEHIYK